MARELSLLYLVLVILLLSHVLAQELRGYNWEKINEKVEERREKSSEKVEELREKREHREENREKSPSGWRRKRSVHGMISTILSGPDTAGTLVRHSLIRWGSFSGKREKRKKARKMKKPGRGGRCENFARYCHVPSPQPPLAFTSLPILLHELKWKRPLRRRELGQLVGTTGLNFRPKIPSCRLAARTVSLPLVKYKTEILLSTETRRRVPPLVCNRLMEMCRSKGSQFDDWLTEIKWSLIFRYFQ